MPVPRRVTCKSVSNEVDFPRLTVKKYFVAVSDFIARFVFH